MKSSDSAEKITRFLRENYKGKLSPKAKNPSDSTFPHLHIELEEISKKDIPKGMDILYGVHETPFGTWLVALSGEKICAISFRHGALADQLQDLSERWNHAKMTEDASVTGKMVKKIFDPETTSRITALVFGTPFQISVWKALLNVRAGSAVSYGDIAKLIGKPLAVRAVGTAVGANPIAYLVPCHRIITGDGRIGQYFGGTDLKISILGSEMA